MTGSSAATDAYWKNGYAKIDKVAPPEVARGLLGIISRHIATPEIGRKMLNPPSVNAKPSYEFYSYRFPLVAGFHWGLTAQMCDLTGKRLLPTYAYFRVYQNGDICTVHSDRPSCEHSMSMPLAYGDDILWAFEIGQRHYEFDVASQIKAATDFGEEPYTSLDLAPGDAILYCGTSRRHGRMSPNPNKWSAHLFLHWVDADGPFKEWAFDRQVLPPIEGFRFPSA